MGARRTPFASHRSTLGLKLFASILNSILQTLVELLILPAFEDFVCGDRDIRDQEVRR
jgi:hypothetical protein